MHFSKLVFKIRPKYLDTFLPNALRVAIGQLRVSSHQLEMRMGVLMEFLKRKGCVDYVT